jgi:type 1 glutamine amidotransferase/nicotinamidase-related amidase
MTTHFRRPSSLFAWLLTITAATAATAADDAGGAASFALQTRLRASSDDGGGKYRIIFKTVGWQPEKTAVIVCDVWDKHWCRSASRRVAEMAPRINEFLQAARRRGALIVHAPSGCMEAYADHPARKRATEAPKAEWPGFLSGWNRGLDCEKDAEWPIDQADGGCDCQPKCPQGHPWKRQIDTIEIDDADAVSDSGIEIGNLLAQRGIDNVILVGVHTNMCVIGRPFGLRNMVRLGKNVVLVRDLTDTMYDSRQRPRVSHVRGTELIVEYIEKHVCPTIVSSSLLGGPAFRFAEDTRPHVALIVSDDHYHADKTLPVFAEELRREHDCYCTVIHGEGTNRFPAMAELETADVVLLYIRRLAPPKEQLDAFRAYLDVGKPLVALRTASHGFDTRGKHDAGHDEWRTFDPEVLGGNYQGHGPNDKGTDVANVAEMADHPILAGVKPANWHSVGSLYFTAPIAADATLLMTGSLGDRVEPVTWIRKYKDARVFYSQLGHPDDFTKPQFRRLLVNAVLWALDRPCSRGTP